MFLISLFYTFSKIQETIWKSGKQEGKGLSLPSFPSKSLSVSVFGIAIGIGVVIAIGIAIVPVAFFFFRSR